MRGNAASRYHAWASKDEQGTRGSRQRHQGLSHAPALVLRFHRKEKKRDCLQSNETEDVNKSNFILQLPSNILCEQIDSSDVNKQKSA